MSDKEEIRQLYRRLYSAMIAKDTAVLDAVFSDDASLEHMTGLVQPKPDFIKAVKESTLNYFVVNHEDDEIEIEGDSARMSVGGNPAKLIKRLAPHNTATHIKACEAPAPTRR